MSSDKSPLKRLIFKRNLDPNQGYRGQLVDLSEKPEQDWLLWERAFEDREKQIPYRLTWVTPDEKTGIHYIEDYIVGFPYIVIDGKDIDKAAEAICSHFEIFSPSELFEIVENPDSTNPDKVEAVVRMGVAAPQEFDPEFFTVFQIAFNAPAPTVRSAALQAWTYCGWEEIIPLVKKMKTSDPDERVRLEAEELLKVYENSEQNT